MHIDPQFTSHLEASWRRLQPAVSVLEIGFSLISFILVMVLILVLRFQVQRLIRQLAGRGKEAAKLAAELEAQSLLARQMSVDLEELRKRLLERQEPIPAGTSGWPSATATPVNLNRRGQILRLSRKGKSVAEIASDLNVAQGEVDLLLKIHDLSQKHPNPEDEKPLASL